MKKIINIIQKIVEIYLPSILIVLVGVTLINDSIIIIKNDKAIVYAIFTILPLVPMLAIYMYLGIRELKHDSNKSYALQHEELSNKDKQIDQLNIMAKSRMLIIDTKQDEIDELKRELASVAKNEKLECTPIYISDTGKLAEASYNSAHSIPFNSDNDNTNQLYMCPECYEQMTRQTDKIAFCDNPSCQRKQWRKDKL